MTSKPNEIISQENKIPNFNLTINGNDDEENIHRLISLLFPEYQQKYIVLKVLNKGFSNTLIKVDYNENDCTTPSQLSTSFLICIHGDVTTTLVDRVNGIKYLKTVKHREGYQQLYGLFNNGSVYSFIDGCDIPVENLCILKYSRLIAEKMAELHCLPTDEFDTESDSPEKNMEPRLFSRILKWIDKLQDDFIISSRKLERYESIFPSKSYALNEINTLKKEYIRSPISKVVLCHNDLNAANIILTPDGNSVHFIDMEYCDLNYAAFDIGNHFCEFTGPNAMEFDKYPSLDFQKKWIKIYLAAYRKHSHSNFDFEHKDSELNIYSEDYLESWLREVNCFALVSHLFWAIWAVIFAAENLTSMDYLAYAAARMKQYHHLKKWIQSTFQLPPL
ncbi:unnamed protein product [Heterobilharzia americana]|nr:unnamed protein product [Heterobilharzia americana]